MSKLIGPFGFKGNIGQLNYYYRKGVARARIRAGGMSIDRIMTDPRLQRVRENITEFKGQALMVKAFRIALAPVKDIRDGSLQLRLVQAFSTIKNFSDEDRGQRSFHLSEFKPTLKGFELSNELPFINVVTAPFSSTPSASRNSSVLQGTIDAATMITAPPAMTHYQIVHLLGTVSDAVYDVDNKKYVLVAPGESGTAIATTSEHLALNADAPVSLSLETALPLETVSDNVTVIEGVGIRFFQQTRNGKFVPFEQGKAMQIVNLF